MSKVRLMAVVMAVVVMMGVTIAPTLAAGDNFVHHVVFHVDDNDKAKMNITLNNAANLTKYYEAKDQKVQIEIVTYGPGLHMLRADSSPVTARLETFSMQYENVAFAACGNTLNGMTKKEGKAPPLVDLDTVRVVPSGVVQLVERQDQGWKYIRP